MDGRVQKKPGCYNLSLSEQSHIEDGALPVKALLENLDHLVYATPDLDQTCCQLGESLGVAPMPAGHHPGWGTRNALLGLGAHMYLEVIGPDPGSPGPQAAPPFNIDRLEGPQLVTWACRGTRLETILQRAYRLGLDLGCVLSGSRNQSDGSTLTWTLTDPHMPRAAGILPFFIDWGDSVHPASSAPTGCTLLSLQAEHPDPDLLTPILEGLGLSLPIIRGDRPKLLARLACPRGQVVLT